MLLLHHFAILLRIMCCCCAVAEIVRVEKDTNSEAADMAMAMALRKTFFWQKMMAQWDCTRMNLHKTKKTTDWQKYVAIQQKCDQWETMARSADAYVRIWEWQNGGKNADGPSGAYSLGLQKISPEQLHEANVPSFLVQSCQLQMSSAMEAFKSAYRYLFNKGKENVLLDNQHQIRFGNEKEWHNVYRLVENRTSNAMGSATDEQNYRAELSTKIAALNELFKILEKEPTKETVKNVYAKSMEVWNIAQQLGLDLSTMCAGFNESWTKAEKDMHKPKLSMKLNNIFESFNYFIKIIFMNERKQNLEIEKSLGQLFMVFKKMIYDPMMELYPEDEELKQLLVKDPCYEAKLKVWKNTDEE